MSLADWTNVNKLNEFATAINAIDAIKGSKPRTTASSIAPIAPIAVAEPRKLKLKEREYLLNWLQIIGETNQEEIEYTINQCESDAVARDWFLSRAHKVALHRFVR
jgi:hypothetical protein